MEEFEQTEERLEVLIDRSREHERDINALKLALDELEEDISSTEEEPISSEDEAEV